MNDLDTLKRFEDFCRRLEALKASRQECKTINPTFFNIQPHLHKQMVLAKLTRDNVESVLRIIESDWLGKTHNEILPDLDSEIALLALTKLHNKLKTVAWSQINLDLIEEIPHNMRISFIREYTKARELIIYQPKTGVEIDILEVEKIFNAILAKTMQRCHLALISPDQAFDQVLTYLEDLTDELERLLTQLKAQDNELQMAVQAHAA